MARSAYSICSQIMTGNLLLFMKWKVHNHFVLLSNIWGSNLDDNIET